MLKKVLQTVFLIVFVASFQTVYAQSKTITGKVTDAANGEAIPGATVVVKGTNIGITTDMDGKFKINVKDPKSVLAFSFVGYVTLEFPVGSNQTVNVSLKSDVTEINEVVVTAQAKGQKNAIKEQISSVTLKNVVAADRLQENPDANAVEAIGRLPGISVLRSGGEGTALVIRGLEPKYTQLTLNGVQMTAGLNGISQYALQGAEVFKSLTADMDANSVAGTVNLKIREAPENLHYNIMAQKGYNNLNKDWGNYKFLGEFSNRFLKDRLGVLFTANAERVNRSTQTMSAGYGIDSNDPKGDILLGGFNMNNISTIIDRRSLLLSLDYKVSPGTTLMLYGMYNNSQTTSQNQAKSYGVGGAGSVAYNFSDNPGDHSNNYQTALSGESKLNFLNIKADYGVAYSYGTVKSHSRNWNFNFNNASTSAITDIEHRKMTPAELQPLFTDNPDRLIDCWLGNMGVYNSNTIDKSLNAYLNFSIPFTIGDQITGNLKVGGMYRVRNRLKDDTSGSQGFSPNGNVYAAKVLGDSLGWVVHNKLDEVSAEGLNTGKTINFLHGQYNFGPAFDFNRLNQMSDTWEKVSEYYWKQGPGVWQTVFGSQAKIGYAQNVQACVMNDQNVKETYSAGYMMAELNYGKYVMFLPGIRIEKTQDNMKGLYAIPPQIPPSIDAPLPAFDTTAVRSDQFILPMIHLRIKPTDSYYLHLSYTQTLSRPDYGAIMPNYFVNTGWSPFTYNAGNPQLRPELWTNYDAQFTFHKGKIGLLSFTAFYKTVKDKIWQRSYDRIKGDPIIPPFPNASKVSVSLWENHPYTAYVKGIEAEWQTNFSYLPRPFCYLTMTANYTFSQSETNYPQSYFILKTPPGGGRPTSARIDTITSGPMIYQPKNIANVSMGYNKKGFNAWLSFQYNGQINTGVNYRGVSRLNSEKNHFYRWDLQLTQKFAIRRIQGFEVIANIANLSDFTETQKLSGDPRPTYQENYGWTADLGFRYRF